jgi:hypothetical protein
MSCFALYNVFCGYFLVCKFVKYSLYECGFRCREYKYVCSREVEKKLCWIMQFWHLPNGYFAIPSVEPHTANERQVFVTKYLWRFDKLSSVYFSFEPPLIKINRRPLILISQSIAAAGAMRTLHKVGANKFGWIQSVYQSLIWRSRMWNSESDGSVSDCAL